MRTGVEAPTRWRPSPEWGHLRGRAGRGGSADEPRVGKAGGAVFPPRNHTAGLGNTQRLSTLLAAPAKFPRPNFSL